jgi:hypothetical protein
MAWQALACYMLNLLLRMPGFNGTRLTENPWRKPDGLSAYRRLFKTGFFEVNGLIGNIAVIISSLI